MNTHNSKIKRLYRSKKKGGVSKSNQQQKSRSSSWRSSSRRSSSRRSSSRNSSKRSGKVNISNFLENLKYKNKNLKPKYIYADEAQKIANANAKLRKAVSNNPGYLYKIKRGN